MEELSIKPSRRAVLRVCHDVNQAGRVVDVRLEPLPSTTSDDVANAAWHAARRRHPWIVGEKASKHLDSARAVALNQAKALLDAVNETLLSIESAQVPANPDERDPDSPRAQSVAHWREGYEAALRDLLATCPLDRLRDCAIDLRGYLFAIKGDTPAPARVQPTIYRRVG